MAAGTPLTRLTLGAASVTDDLGYYLKLVLGVFDITAGGYCLGADTLSEAPSTR